MLISDPVLLIIPGTLFRLKNKRTVCTISKVPGASVAIAAT